MNAHAKFVNFGPYEPIPQERVITFGVNGPIGGTKVHAPQSAAGTAQQFEFDPQANLTRLATQILFDVETLAAAEAALGRIEPVDLDTWSTELAVHFAKLAD